MNTSNPRANKQADSLRLPVAIAAALLSLMLSSGCSSTRSGSSRVPASHAGVAHRLDQGTVVGTREVVIDGQATDLGRISGAAIGGAAGSVVAGNSVAQRTIGIAVGGVVGSIVGNEVEKKLSEKRAQELTIQLDSGEVIVVVWPMDDGAYLESDRIQVYTTASGATRIIGNGIDPNYDPNVEAYGTDGLGGPPAEPVNWFAATGTSKGE